MGGGGIMKADELARFITDFIFYDKETVLKALEEKDEEMLRDEAYEYIMNCD